jgi:catechol 2,3-dioxygenase-like lactoylglutathione lyase family enzyme
VKRFIEQKNIEISDLTPHHVGCAVSEMEDGCATYAGALGLTRKTRSFYVSSQNVHVCFLELGTRFYLELVAPSGNEAKFASFLKVGFYHLCFLVNDLAAVRDHLTDRQFSALPAFESEAFGGSPCQFFVTPQLHLVELAQMSMMDFDVFFGSHLTVES